MRTIPGALGAKNQESPMDTIALFMVVMPKLGRYQFHSKTAKHSK